MRGDSGQVFDNCRMRILQTLPQRRVEGRRASLLHGRHYFPTKKALNSHKKSAICADYAILFDDSDEEEDHADCAVSAADPPASDAWPVLRQDDPDRYGGFELESDE